MISLPNLEATKMDFWFFVSVEKIVPIGIRRAPIRSEIRNDLFSDESMVPLTDT